MNYMIIPGIKGDARHDLTTPEERLRIYDHICSAVCQHYGIDQEELMANNKTRKRQYVLPRQICMFLFVHKVREGTLGEKGAYFGKDHATVLHAVNTIKGLRSFNRFFRQNAEPLLKDFAV